MMATKTTAYDTIFISTSLGDFPLSFLMEDGEDGEYLQ